MPITLGMLVGRRRAQSTYVGTASSSSNASSYTFSGQAIGTAASDRYVIVAATGGANFSQSINSCTVGGAATTRVANVSGFECAAIFITNAPVTSGTTADIVINCSSTLLQMQSVVYVINGSPVLHDTLATTGTNPSGSIDAALNGCIVAIATHNDSSHTATWTGLTENDDTALEDNRNTWASLNPTAAESNRTVGVTFSSSVAGDVLVAASWRPA